LVFSLGVLAYFYYIVELGGYESFSIGLLIFFLFDFLDNLGKRVVVLDIAVILAIFTWLIMPVIFYQFYTKADHVARIFHKYMPIPAEEYFSFAVPGTVLMILGFKIPLLRLQINSRPDLFKVKLEAYFKGKDWIGFLLIGISLVSGFLYPFVPSTLERVVGLLERLSYVGVFYIFFSGNKHKGKILLGVTGLLLATSISTGMFGELVFLMALFYILIALYLKRRTFFYKLGILVLGVFAIFLIQNVKSAYRLKAWKTGSDASYFGELVLNSLEDPSAMFQKKSLFHVSIRMNQGWLIATTMDRVPKRYDYANGETIALSVAAAFIPRVFWPDKPEAGGKYNLKRFWGYDLVGYSMNIGPIGEAYANFGVRGGIFFMFFYGLFFNMVLTWLLKRSESSPSVLCWIPFLFSYAVVVETDILTTVGSIVTSLMFMLLFGWLFKAIFKVKL
jgi:hypothetical protein